VTPTTSAEPGPAARSWADALAAWAVPEELLAQAGRSPWGHPVSRFVARAREGLDHPGGASQEEAEGVLDALAAAGRPGSVLDVGAGAGSACLPLRGWASRIVALDRNVGMLAALDELAAELGPGAPVSTVEGMWPQAAAQVGEHDLVVCHHVLFDVADIGPFLLALTAAARVRVVVEIPPLHPMTWLNPLWQEFHEVPRPTRPTADDVVAVLRELGVADLCVHRWVQRDRDAEVLGSTADRVALVTRRLCLPVEREPEVAAAMAQHPPAELRDRVTIGWAGSAPALPAAET
jgi:SAM-dependent methyltransferase